MTPGAVAMSHRTRTAYPGSMLEVSIFHHPLNVFFLNCKVICPLAPKHADTFPLIWKITEGFNPEYSRFSLGASLVLLGRKQNAKRSCYGKTLPGGQRRLCSLITPLLVLYLENPLYTLSLGDLLPTLRCPNL